MLSVCVVDANGKIVREGRVTSEPDALIGWLGSLGYDLSRIGLEAGPLSQWLFAAMREAGLAVELLETRHVHKAFEAMPVKSDRNDARGIAPTDAAGLVPAGALQVNRGTGDPAMLTARKLVQSKLLDVENSLRGILRGFRAEGRQGHVDKFRRAHRGVSEGPSEPSNDRRSAASGTGGSACRIQRL